MPINKLFIITWLALTPALAAAAIYKWVDEQGNVQYSSEKPRDAEAEKVSVNTQPPVDRSTYRKPGQDDAKADDTAKKDAEDDKTFGETLDPPAAGRCPARRCWCRSC